MSRRHNLNTFHRAAAAAPAAAGHRPLLLAVALAAGFAALPARAQPAGAQAVVGAASLSQQGSKLVVTTQNGPGANFSSINWQSFSVPAGTTTHFTQPGVTSTSINRVLGPDPSAIFGTLSSNGRLVLVNPAGITVGAGAVVDTAAFTASTLRLSDADALAGRLRFADGTGGALRVDGQVLARRGDVVLIGQNVQTGPQALVQSPQGATILAAGQKVEVTGRGLEGIFFEVQAPADQAVNLGTLQGDAVGVFAGTLRHSGLVQAQAISTQGGKVVLRAADMAQVAGTVQAQGVAGAGGSVDVLGSRVGVMAGARIDTSNTAGGGRIRIGGDYQGGNAAVPNAQVAYVDREAQLRANATVAGNGGRVIVWADDTTRAYGSIEAKAGPQGGDGGFVETSGKRYLDANGIRVNASAAQGAAGTWLLDPTDIYIVGATPAPTAPPILDLGLGPLFQSVSSLASTLEAGTLSNALLTATNVTISTTSTGGGNGDIIFSGAGGNVAVVHNKSTDATLTLQAQRNIQFESGSSTAFQNTGTGSTFNVQMQAANGIVTDLGATVSASTSDPTSSVTLTVPTGKTWTHNGTLTLDQNGLVGLDGARFVNNGVLNGAAGSSGGIGGAAGSGTFENNGSVFMSQGVFKVAKLQQTPAPTAAPAPSFSLYGGTQMQVSSDFAVTGGSFDFAGDSLSLTQASGSLVVPASGSSISATGAVQLKALAGDIDLQRSVQAGSITATASGNISTVDLSTYGVYGAASGAVNLNAGGTASFGSIDSSGNGTYGSSGGAVTIGGTLGVSGGWVTSTGSNGGAGGAVSISSQGDVALSGDIYTDGGYAYSGNGGNAGPVTLVSQNGSVSAVGGISASGGGSSLGAGGGGGAVTVSAAQAINVGYVDTYGGDAGSTTSQKGGNGGAITLAAGTALSVLSDLASGGGWGGDNLAGAGGAGGAGGAINLSAANGTIDLTGVNVDSMGGSGGTGATTGGAGGAGGAIAITAGNGAVTTAASNACIECSPWAIEANGGWGGDTIGTASTDRGGAGGKAGTVTINATAASSLLGEIRAEGGGGGWATDTSGGVAVGGAGGAGGGVVLNLAGGGTLGSGVYATGGEGGRAQGPLGDDPARSGASGAVGTLRTTGGAITVPASPVLPTVGTAFDPDGMTSLNVDARWTNDATLVLSPYAWLLTSQPATNNGTVDLGYGSVFSVGRYDAATYTFAPGGAGATFTNSAAAVLKGEGTLEAGTVFNAGTVLPGDSANNPYGPIGRFSIAGNLVQQPTGKIVFDIAANSPFQPGSTYDQLQVSGTAVLDGALQVNALPAVTVPAATPVPTPAPTQPPLLAAALTAPATTDTYVLLDVAGGASGSFSSYSGPGDVLPLLQMNSGGSLLAIPGAALPPAPPPPAPVPAPVVLASDPLVDKIVGLLNGSATSDQVEAALAEQDNLVTKFLDKLVEEDEKQKDAAKGEIVYTDTACKPS